MVERLPFQAFENLDELREQDRFIFEPCCGSATFLVAALQRLRRMWRSHKLTAEERHWYFRKILVGLEREPFGIEVSRLCLTLADFPNKDLWQLHEADVIVSDKMSSLLGSARVVLCNPPFEDFKLKEREEYQRRGICVQSVHRPAEILGRTLSHLHPEGVLGFVLPQVFLDGKGYKGIREALAKRFGKIEVISLPDKAFTTSDKETVLMLASDPRASGAKCKVIHRKVNAAGWEKFRLYHLPNREDSAGKTAEEAAKSLAVPEFGRLWTYLANLDPLGRVAKVHRGIEWNIKLTNKGKETGNRNKVVLDDWREGFRKGIPPRAKPFHAFQCPPTKYLDMRPNHQRTNAYELPWDSPKVILNAKTKSRGPWRISAFADLDQLVCYQTFTAVWPTDPSLVVFLAAILNSPIANAFIATREGKTDITAEVLELIPIPPISDDAKRTMEAFVRRYVEEVSPAFLERQRDWKLADRLLKQIDAFVLQAYNLPPRIERDLLDYFRHEKRQVPFSFEDYFPADFRPSFSLAYYLSDAFQQSMAFAFRARYQQPPEQVLKAMDAAIEAYGE
jgi:hypothetical protein